MIFFIIGGAGFIGSNLAKYLTTQGHRVLIYDNLLTGRKENLDDIDYVSCSIKEGIEYCDAIFHLAASVGVEYVNGNPMHTMCNNLSLDETVFTLNAIHQKPLLFASTSEVYGNSTNIPFKETQPLSIGEPSKGRWGYACSKLMGEFLSLHAPFPSVVVRFFNVTGPRQLPDYGMVMPRFVHAGIKGEKLKIYNPNATRCYCHIDDVVVVLEKLLIDESCYNQVFNIGNPNNMVTVEELAHRVDELTGHRGTVIYECSEELRLETDIAMRVPDISKVRDMTGWVPRKDLGDIILDMIEYEVRINNGN